MLTDGKLRQVHYSIIEDGGFAGFGQVLLGRGVHIFDAAHAYRVPGAACDGVHDGVRADTGARGAVGDRLANPLGKLTARRGLQSVAEHPAHPAVRP